MSASQRFKAFQSAEPPREASPAEVPASTYRYILGAVLIVLLLVLVLTFANPSSAYDYLAVTGYSLRESNSPGLKTARVSIEVQTLLMLTGIIIAVIFWSTRSKSYSGYAVLGAVVVLTLGLLVFRTATALHLDVYFWLLALLYFVVACLAAYNAIHFFRTRKDTISALGLGAVSLLFFIAVAGAVSVAVVAVTGDEASNVIDDMEGSV
jgi:hypothetical protein